MFYSIVLARSMSIYCCIIKESDFKQTVVTINMTIKSCDWVDTGESLYLYLVYFLLMLDVPNCQVVSFLSLTSCQITKYLPPYPSLYTSAVKTRGSNTEEDVPKDLSLYFLNS